jgi:hypothetical protein
MPGSSPGMTSVCLRRHLVSVIRLRVLAARCARGLPEIFLSLQTEGAGNTGCALHPRSRVQKCTKQTHTSIQVQRRQSGIPCAMVLTAYFVLSPATGLSCHRRPRKSPSANLTPASGRQDHTTSPSASSALVRSTIRVHRIPPPTSVTIAKRPSVWDGMARI